MSKQQYAVIFTAKLRDDAYEYGSTAEQMEAKMRTYDGFVSFESVRGTDGFGITVCIWESLEALQTWKKDLDHQEAQRRGKTEWYEYYKVRVAKIEYEYDHSK
jgi:heme-degrading monooxygenase HmoA